MEEEEKWTEANDQGEQREKTDKRSKEEIETKTSGINKVKNETKMVLREEEKDKDQRENKTEAGKEKRGKKTQKREGRTKRESRKQRERRKHRKQRKNKLGKIGLVEYNESKGRWECRIDDCKEEMNTTRKIAQHRKNITPNSTTDQTRRKYHSPIAEKH